MLHTHTHTHTHTHLGLSKGLSAPLVCNTQFPEPSAKFKCAADNIVNLASHAENESMQRIPIDLGCLELLKTASYEQFQSSMLLQSVQSKKTSLSIENQGRGRFSWRVCRLTSGYQISAFLEIDSYEPYTFQILTTLNR